MHIPEKSNRTSAPFIATPNQINFFATEAVPVQHVPLAEWLPITKFQPPAAYSDLVERPHLLHHLQTAIDNHRLTLISAPAGSGKTTVLTQLGDQPCDRRLAWLRLDQYDNHPTIFFVGIVQALASLAPGFGRNLLTWIATADQFANLGAPEAIQPAIGLLINEITQSLTMPCTLVLDDCHRLAHPAIFAGLDYLLEHIPATLRIIIATRHDPPLKLDRLRGQGALAEFRFDELAFSEQETASFLQTQWRDNRTTINLSAAIKQTQGWPVGLRLLANARPSAHNRADHEQMDAAFSLATLAQNSATPLVLTAYLLDEVLTQQPAEVRVFLLQTSLLTELTPALCSAVTGRHDAADLLARLYRSNLFITQAIADQTRATGTPTYRYHDLFGDFLRQRLSIELPEQVAELQRRAALAETVLERKLAHLLAGEWWELAAQLLSEVGEHLLQQGLLDALQEWLNQLPVAVQEEHPQLLYLQGVCQWQRRALEPAQVSLSRALLAFQASNNQKAEGETITHLASCAMFSGNFAAALQWIDHGLTLPITANNQVQLLLARLWINYNRPTPNWEQAEQDFAQALQVAQTQNDRPTLRSFTMLSAAALVMVRGGLVGIDWITTRCQALSPPPDPFWQVVLTSLRAWHDWLRGQPLVAEQQIERCLALGEAFAHLFHTALLDLHILRVEILSAREEYATAHQIIGDLIQSAELTPMLEPTLVINNYLQLRLYWQQGLLAEMHECYRKTIKRFGEGTSPSTNACLPAMRALLALGERRFAEAEQQLQQALALENDSRSGTLVVQPRILHAYLHWQWHGAQAGLQLFAPILAQHEGDNTPGFMAFAGACVVPLLKLAVRHNLHTEFALCVLDLLELEDAPPRPIVAESGMALSAREVEIVQLLSGGATNNEIATHLGITLPTVKSHTTRVFQKLGVTTRKEAAIKARELGLGRIM